jgi:hypothetical protein
MEQHGICQSSLKLNGDWPFRFGISLGKNRIILCSGAGAGNMVEEKSSN